MNEICCVFRITLLILAPWSDKSWGMYPYSMCHFLFFNQDLVGVTDRAQVLWFRHIGTMHELALVAGISFS